MQISYTDHSNEVYGSCMRKAAASATGFIDGWGYLGAGLQSISTGLLVDHWGWNAGFAFWIACAFLRAGLLVLLWRHRSSEYL